MAILVLNLTTDLCIVTLPLPILLCARMDAIRRIGLILLLSAGIFVMTAAILRVAFVFKATTAGGATAADIWACGETLVATLAANAVFLLPLFQRSLWTGCVTSPSTGKYEMHAKGMDGKEESIRGVRRFKHPLDMNTFSRATRNGTVVDVESEIKV